MPVPLTYPGVYVQEIPSGVRTITGVATAITAFLGRALRGPEDTPVTVNNFGDFERIFGGLWTDSSLGYAVRDFFLNGGGQALVVRAFNADSTAGAKTSTAKIKVGAFTFNAASKGAWGGNLRASMTQNAPDDVAKSLGLDKSDLFDLAVTEISPGGGVARREIYRNLSFKDSPRRVDKVLKAQSALLSFDPTTLPTPIPAIAAADDEVTKNEAALKALLAQQPPPSQADVKTATDALNKAKDDASASNGLALTKANFTPQGGQAKKLGLYALDKVDLFNLLCIPPYLATGDVDAGLWSDAATYCESRRAMLIVDPPSGWADSGAAKSGFLDTQNFPVGRSKNAALFFPRLRAANPLRDNQLEDFAPCGAIAGIFARTDAERGVWKAPAGIQATINGPTGLTVPLTDAENGDLNQLGVNCLRGFSVAGNLVWGARTMRGADQLADEYKYIPVRRTALFIEESLFRGLQWVVFEPNDEPLWAQIRLNVGAFMQNLFRQGAFKGQSPREAYFVKCDRETTTQNDVNLGVVNVVVGFAPLKPAEFVVISLQQIAGQIAA